MPVEWKCAVCGKAGAHVTEASQRAWIAHCDEHDPRSWFQTLREIHRVAEDAAKNGSPFTGLAKIQSLAASEIS